MTIFRMLVACCFSVCLSFMLSVSQISAAELDGKITGIKGNEFYIEMSSKELPRKGDMVSIILDLDGEGFEAGKAEVVEAKKNRVTAKTTEGSASIDMKVLIQTAGPSSRSSAYQDISSQQLHLCDELAGVPFVEFKLIDTVPAIAACEDAVKENPKAAGFIFQLGRIYHASKQYQKALRYYRQAAEQGHANAQHNLGVMYKMGEGVSMDWEEAFKWYRKAAEQGNAPSQFSLGVMYKNGWGVAENHGKGIKLLRKAAEQGLARAQYKLGYMYDYGNGVTRDEAEAIKWYRKAAAQNYEDAKSALRYMGVKD